MKDPTDFTWDDVRRIADEIDLKAHLASMELRDRWEKLRPKLAELRATFDREAGKAGVTIGEQFTAIGKGLAQLRDEILDELNARPRQP